MQHFYRVRALVDSSAEEAFCLAADVNAAMDEFERVEARDTGEPFGSYGIDVAMVHRIAFGESGPVFEDVTYQLDERRWSRAGFEQCLGFYLGFFKERNHKDWTTKPMCCPYCGSKDIRESSEWEATSTEEEDNTCQQTEYQCQGACEGRSFWC